MTAQLYQFERKPLIPANREPERYVSPPLPYLFALGMFAGFCIAVGKIAESVRLPK